MSWNTLDYKINNKSINQYHKSDIFSIQNELFGQIYYDYIRFRLNGVNNNDEWKKSPCFCMNQ